MARDDERARQAPKEAVDALEHDPSQEGTGPSDIEGQDADTPAFELDLDPEDQGSADAAAANPD